MKTITYRIVKDPSWGDNWYLVGGVGYPSLKALKAAYPGCKFKRVKMRPLYG